MLSFLLNDRLVRTSVPPGMVLLDFVRDEAGLCGTKEACREGECGACTVLVGTPRADGTVGYKACASCLLPVGDVAGCHVVTVEGLGAERLTLVQELMVAESASQCGFCSPGIVLSLTGFCLTSPTLGYEEAIDALDGNLCRCTGYVAIRNAARALCERLAPIDRDPSRRLSALVEAGVLPPSFLTVGPELAAIEPPAETGGELVAGGTDLFVQRPEELRDRELRFLSRRRDLDYVRVEDGLLRIGGAVTIEDFRCSPAVRQHLPALERDLLLHSSTILRNKATLTGNVVNASPIGDATVILLALDARLLIADEAGRTREVPLERFFLDYKKVDLARDEIVREIAVPLLPNNGRFHFEKVSNRVTLDIAAVNSALRVTTAADATIDELRLSAGGVAPIPLLVDGLDAFHGRRIDEETIGAIAEAATAAARPIDDIRGTARYKKLLLGQLVRAHFMVPR